MNMYRLAIGALLCSAFFSSCKKDDGTITPPAKDSIIAPYARLSVTFANEADGQPIALGPVSYTNAAGNPYSVDVLKYYVSNFTLVKADGTERNFKTHELIDAANPASLSFTLDSVVNGDYTSVKFLIGVDGDHNHTGNQEGDLDPSNGMIWTWNTGYIFFKHEGNYKDSAGGVHALVLHLGTDRALTYINIPITKLTVAGSARKLFLKFNLNSAYTTPGNMDFHNDHFRMSDADDAFWISGMQSNLTDAFQYDKAE